MTTPEERWKEFLDEGLHERVGVGHVGTNEAQTLVVRLEPTHSMSRSDDPFDHSVFADKGGPLEDGGCR